MPTTHAENVEAIMAEIYLSLGYDPKNPPSNVEDKHAATVLGLKPGTLSVWRSTGRYNLPYIKSGRLVRYRVRDIAEFMARRTACHTGEAA